MNRVALPLLVALWLFSPGLALPRNNSTGNFTFDPGLTLSQIAADECETVTVESGDSCGSLAKKCGISAADFNKYNPEEEFCSKLAPGGRACCTEGELPDIRPQTEPNGTCASYVTQEGDNCAEIAAKNGLVQGDIDDFNKEKTWGFDSCQNLGLGVRICLSKGTAPMPGPQVNSTCGPTKPGSEPWDPDSDVTLADINPCPLNACCNIWGQCGITGDFCIATKGEFGNPGVGPPGSNGCTSSCGQEIVNNNAGPGSFMSIGYYESWNLDRPCLTMKAAALEGSKYTHIHWGFGMISKDLEISINDTYKQWDDFKSLRKAGIKIILSLGGWGYSTSQETYDILRNAVSPDGRETFTDNLAAFAKDEGLDGIDIDWEYPGVPDRILGIPPGEKDDGKNYLEMLKLLKSKLHSGKSLSIAAPASYWYLKAFPIGDMVEHLDYIVYMTYDLHGLWDTGNQWAQPGCPEGNCLRSHVNITETFEALTMITKADVDTNKIVVGISSYGRSFKMVDPGCTGPMCKWEGIPAPGKCTGTGGYLSNAEIESIKKLKPESKSWYDEETDADYLVYDSTEWTSYLSKKTKESRAARWKGLNFAGTVDWAVDLMEFSEDEGCPEGTCNSPGTLYVGPNIFTDENPLIECDSPCELILPPFILPGPTTITFPHMTTSLEVAWTETKTVTDDEGSTSILSSISRVVQTTTLTIPPLTTTAIELWNQHHQDDDQTLIWLTWSIKPPPFTITNDPNPKNEDKVTHPLVTRTINPPPWPYSWSTPTTTPTPTITHGTSTLHSSVHITKQTGEPGPKCTSNCGHECKIFCDHPCPPGLCPPPPRGFDNNDFYDPEDPNPPPGPPPGGPDPVGGESDICQPEVKINTGLCDNGNYPIWDPVSLTVRCDVPAEEANSAMTECQRDVDSNLDESKDEVDYSTSCCPAKRLEALGLRKRQINAGGSCPLTSDFPNNPPDNGEYHTVFTCDYDKWPNVCANARSAIEVRGKTPILTYSAGGGDEDSVHSNRPWYHQKFRSSTYGWTLNKCQVEEYPFANGDPVRVPDIKKWDEQRVLRLIPQSENGDHGRALSEWLRGIGGGSHKNAHGVIYSMEFINHPTGTSDADFYLDDAGKAKNLCAQPYGNEFILVNKASVNKGERDYDPWWDDKLITKTIKYYLGKGGTATSWDTSAMPKMYCKNPSPGAKDVDNNGVWYEVSPGMTQNRKKGLVGWKCDDYPGYNGPSERPPVKQTTNPSKKRAASSLPSSPLWPVNTTDEMPVEEREVLSVGGVPQKTQQQRSHGKNGTVMIQSEDDNLAGNVSTTSRRRNRSLNPALMTRQSGSIGSFLDPGAWVYLGCGSSEDLDNCAESYGCYVDTLDPDATSDDGGWGDDVPGDDGGDDDDDDGDDDDGNGSNVEPLPFDYGVQWSSNSCGIDDTSVYSYGTSSCEHPSLSGTGAHTNSARAYAKNNLNVCFYKSRDCTAKDSSGYIRVKGGANTKGADCISFAGGEDIGSWEVTDRKCHGDGLEEPDARTNEKRCYNSGQKSSYGKITAAAESFCRDVVDDSHGPVWSNYRLTGKKNPPGDYHFKLEFEVFEGCMWTVSYDECMRYMKVPIDSCDCSQKGDKQGGTVTNNCIFARIDPNKGQ